MITLHPLTIPRPVADAAHYLRYFELYADAMPDDDDAPTRPMTLAEHYASEWGRHITRYQDRAEATWRAERGRALRVVGHYTNKWCEGRASLEDIKRLKRLNQSIQRRVNAIRAQVRDEWTARSEANTCRALVVVEDAA